MSEPLELGRIVGTKNSLVFPDRMRERTHVHVPGASGRGKSKFLEHLICQDVLEGRGVWVLDPHGILARAVRSYVARMIIPPKHFYYIHPADDQWTCAYNPLSQQRDDDWYLTNSLKEALLKCWGETDPMKTPLIDEWLKTSLYTGIKLGLTLPELGMLLESGVDRNQQRAEVMNRLPEAETTMRGRWARLCYYADKRPVEFNSEVLAVSRRLSVFNENPRLARMYGVPNATIDIASLMDEKAVVVVDLSPGERFSRQDADVFGTFLMTDIYLQMTRRKRPDRRSFVYIDEFQRFKAPDLSNLLDECRKYGINFTLAHQRPGQLLNSNNPEERDVWSAVMTNAGHKIVFGGVSPSEARELAELFTLGIYNPNKVKDEIWTRSVTDYVTKYMKTHGKAKTTGTSDTSSSGSALVVSRDADGQESGRSETEISSGGVTTVDLETVSESSTETLAPIMADQLSSRQFESPEEQILQVLAALYDQKQRHAIVKVSEQNEPISIEVPFVDEPEARPHQVERLLLKGRTAAPWLLPVEEATAAIEERRKAFLALGAPEVQPRQPQESHATVNSQEPMKGDSSTSTNERIRVGNIDLTERDIDLLVGIYDTRFTTIPHAAYMYFTGPNITQPVDLARKRLKQLADAGLLRVKERKDKATYGSAYIPGRRGTQVKKLYIFAKKAYDVLSTQAGRLPEMSADAWDRQVRKRFDFADKESSQTIPHELGVFDVQTAFQYAVSDHKAIFIHEFGVWPLRYEFEISLQGIRRPTKPDGFIHLVELPLRGDEPIHHYFYLEVDQSNETHAELADKMHRYNKWRTSGGYLKWLGAPDGAKPRQFPFRVLFVTAKGEARRNNIRDNLGIAGFRGGALSATLQDVVNNPFAAIWYAAGSTGPQALLEDVSTTPPAPSGEEHATMKTNPTTVS